MHVELGDWKNGRHGVHLGLSPEDIDVLIERLRMLKAEPGQHFHLSSTFRGGGGVGDITVYVQDPSQPSNMEPVGGKALAPGATIPIGDVRPKFTHARNSRLRGRERRCEASAC